jgi:hypothetical protein
MWLLYLDFAGNAFTLWPVVLIKEGFDKLLVWNHSPHL